MSHDSPTNFLRGFETIKQQSNGITPAVSRELPFNLFLSLFLKKLVVELRGVLNCDRLILYQFLPKGDGFVAEEAVRPGCLAIMGQLIYDPCFPDIWAKKYQQGQISRLQDAETETLTDCYRDLLTRLQVRANLAVPIILQPTNDPSHPKSFSQLWGLLIAHECHHPRSWNDGEISQLQQIAQDLGKILSPSIEQTLLPKATEHKPNSTFDDCLSSQDLVAFNRLQTPIWIFDIQQCQMWWANDASLHIWQAKSREELLNRNFKDASEATRLRLQHYLQQFQQGKTVTETWTFYPGGKPVSIRCLCSGIVLPDRRLAMLVEGSTEVVNHLDPETLRSLEALRHTTLMVSLFTLDGIPLLQNPAALDCYGDQSHPPVAQENLFLRHFVDPEIGELAIATVRSGQVFSIETQVYTRHGIRIHGLDLRYTQDPVTGNPMMLVHEKDITQKYLAFQQRQQAEEKLRWKEVLLRSMTDTSTLAFFVVDNNTDAILYFNHRFCEIWQIEHLEAQMQAGKLKNNDIIPDCARLIADLPAFIETCKPLQSKENRIVIEDEIALIDGRTIRRFSSQIRNQEDQYFGRLYIFEDITDRKQLQRSLQLTDFSFECLSVAATWITVDGLNIRVNEAACQMLGYSRQEFQSLHVYDLDPNLTLERWHRHWQELKQLKHITLISQHRHKSGEMIPVEVTLNYVEFQGTAYNFAFARDIRDRLQAAAALQESEERYRSVISAMAEGVVLQQADGQITACNESAERILGLTAAQMMGRTSIDPNWRSIHEDGSEFPGDTHPASVTLRTGKPQFNVIMGVHKPDRSLTWISINSQPLFQTGQLLPYAVVTSFTDITPAKQAEAALRQQAERERMVHKISQHIRQSLDLGEILQTTVEEVRHFLQTDRVIIYRFQEDWTGQVVTESVAAGWNAIIGMQLTDSYLVEHQNQSFQPGQIKFTPDIYQAGLSDCHLDLLAKLQVRSKLVVPIWQGEQGAGRPQNHLWGLLIAYQCRSTRNWQPGECDLLQQLAEQLAIAIQQSQLYQQLQTANQQLENLAWVDSLTQIANRRSFDQHLDQQWHHLGRDAQPLSLLLCDVDYFKQYNDLYGHSQGDRCLRQVAQVLSQAVNRSLDLVARYGGEEFAIILPHTSATGAMQVAQNLLTKVQQLKLPHQGSAIAPHLTLSIGIATIVPQEANTISDFINAADQALYQAKHQGRNRYILAPETH